MSLHKVLDADLVPESLGLWHEDDLGIVHHTNVPRNASDQGGHIDGAFTRDHLLPVSEHGSDWRATDLLCHGEQVLQPGKLQRRRSAQECTTMESHLARNLGVGLWMETMLFLLLIGSFDIALQHEFRS